MQAYPLEPSDEEMRRMGEDALAFLTTFIEDLPEAPAVDLEGIEEIVASLREGPPEEGSDFAPLLNVVATAAAKGFNPAGPGYLAFIPGGGLFAAAIADFLACGVNRFVNLWSPSPALVRLEQNVVRWLCDLFCYPQTARGILTSGGSISNLSAIVTARTSLLGEGFSDGTLYVSDQTHASVAKAAVLAGFPRRNVRVARTASSFRLDAESLRNMIEADRGEGLRPFCIVANAGTTNTGAIDPIADLVGLAREEGMWLHVDAAYGGFFQLTERGRVLFRGIEEADSITLDPHKGMFLPYGTGALLVRDGAKLRDAHHVAADYLQDLAPEGELPNFSEYSPELSRDFRGLRVWLPLKLHGFAAFRDALDEKLDLARHLYEALRTFDGFDVLEPELSVVAFRYRPRSGDADEFNRGLLERINASRRVFLSSSILDGRFTLRACILCHRTHLDRVEEAAAIIRRAAQDPAR
ncbi:aminotransferase class I/II-fold pyridoxal phosphate-dependent enzyme [soil metagenome]